MAEPASAASINPASRDDPNSPPHVGTDEATVAARAAKQTPTWNRLRSKPGWYCKQVHLLRGLRPREARVPPPAQGMNHLREGRTSSSGVLVKGESATSQCERDPSCEEHCEAYNPRTPLHSSIDSNGPAVVLSRMWRGSKAPACEMPCERLRRQKADASSIPGSWPTTPLEKYEEQGPAGRRTAPCRRGRGGRRDEGRRQPVRTYKTDQHKI